MNVQVKTTRECGQVIEVERSIVAGPTIADLTLEDIKRARDATRYLVLFLGDRIGTEEKRWYSRSELRFL